MKLKIWILCALVSMLASCGPTETQRLLREADAVMESDPDNALAVLARIDRSALWGEDLAYYALLKTQGDVKCNVIVDSDSLISIAQEHYADSRDEDKKKRAAFYTAQVELYRRSYPDAMRAVLPAYEIAKDSKDYYWMAKTSELIADIFAETYNYPQDEKYTREAVSNYQRAGKVRNHRFALCDLGINLINQNKLNEGLTILDSVYNIGLTELPIDTLLVECALMGARKDLLKVVGFDNMRAGITRFSVANGSILQESSFEKEKYDVETDFRKGKKPSFEELISYIDNDERLLQLLYINYKYLKSIGSYETAVNVADSILQSQTSIILDILNQSTVATQKDFYDNLSGSRDKENKRLILTISTLILLAISLVTILIMIYRLTVRKKENEIKDQLNHILILEKNLNEAVSRKDTLEMTVSADVETIHGLKDNLSDIQRQKEIQAKMIESLFRNQWNTINMLCSEYYQADDSAADQKRIMRQIRDEIEKIHSPENLKKIERSVNLYFGDIMKLMRLECIFFKEQDFVFLALIYAGFKAKAVCLFLDLQYKNFYLRKARYIKKIEASDVAHKEFFLANVPK